MATSVRRQRIANGDDGIGETLRVMADAIDRASDDPAVVSVARRLIAREDAGHNQAQGARIVQNWLVRVWRYVDDPVHRELLRDANAMLREQAETGIVAGDCDEAAILGASLGVAVGIPAELTVYAFDDGSDNGAGVSQYSHVFATLLPDNGPEVTLDVTRPRAGTPIPAITRSLTVPV